VDSRKTLWRSCAEDRLLAVSAFNNLILEEFVFPARANRLQIEDTQPEKFREISKVVGATVICAYSKIGRMLSRKEKVWDRLTAFTRGSKGRRHEKEIRACFREKGDAAWPTVHDR